MPRAGEWKRARAGLVCTWAMVQTHQADTPGMGLLFLTSCFLLLCLLLALKRPVQVVFVKSGWKHMYPLPLFPKYNEYFLKRGKMLNLGNNSCQKLQSLKISTVVWVKKWMLSSRMTHLFHADTCSFLPNAGLECVLPCLRDLSLSSLDPATRLFHTRPQTSLWLFA